MDSARADRDEALSNKRGLDVEINQRLAAKFDPARAQACLDWISATTKLETTDDFWADLKDGYLLSRLLLMIDPRIKKKVRGWKPKKSDSPFVCRTTISNFCEGCKKLGMREGDVFTSVDLWEGQNLNNVVNCLYALNALAQSDKCPKFTGPFIDGGHVFSKTKEYTAEDRARHKKANAGVVPKLMMGSKKMEAEKRFDSYGIVKSTAKSSSAVPKLAQPRKQEVGSNFDHYGIVKSTAKSSNVVPKLAMGGVKQEASSGFDSYGIVKSTAKSAGGPVPKFMQGSVKQEASSGFDSYGIVKSQAKASSAVPKLAQPRKQEASSTFDSYGIVKSTAKPTSAIPKLAQPKPKTEPESRGMDSYGIIKTGDTRPPPVPVFLRSQKKAGGGV